MELENSIKKFFEKIIEIYNLRISIISENEVVLFSDNYILSFLLHSAELELVYIEKRENKELYQYNIDSFITYSISDEDRMKIKSFLINVSKLELELGLLAYILEKKWGELLLGGNRWIQEYENFMLYIPARNVTRLKEKSYKGKCLSFIMFNYVYTLGPPIQIMEPIDNEYNNYKFVKSKTRIRRTLGKETDGQMAKALNEPKSGALSILSNITMDSIQVANNGYVEIQIPL